MSEGRGEIEYVTVISRYSSPNTETRSILSVLHLGYYCDDNRKALLKYVAC